MCVAGGLGSPWRTLEACRLDSQIDLNLILLKVRVRTVHLEIGRTNNTRIIHMSPLRLGIGTIIHGGMMIIGIGHLLVVGRDGNR